MWTILKHIRGLIGFLFLLVALFGAGFLGGNILNPKPPESVATVQPNQPRPLVTPATPAPAVVMTATRVTTMTTALQPGNPIRVNFSTGSYGANRSGQLVGTTDTYALWARGGQVMKLALTVDGGSAQLALQRMDNGSFAWRDLGPTSGVTTTLPANGDYLVHVYGRARYQVAFEIK